MRTRSKGWAGLALLAGFALRWWFVHFHAFVQGDSLVYGDLATNMLQHHIYGLTEAGRIRSTLIRLPGYPFLLAGCFAVAGAGNYASVLWLQVFLDMAGCCLLARLAQRVAGRSAGMCTFWLGVLCPFTAAYTAAPLTETAAAFCASLGFFAFERWYSADPAAQDGAAGLETWRWTIVLGVTLSFAVLLRPDRALLAVALVAAMVAVGLRKPGPSGRQAWWNATAVCLLIVLPLVPWTWRNWRSFRVLQPLAPRSATDPGEPVTPGFERWYRTWAIDFKSTVDVYWTYDGAALSMRDLPERAFDNRAERMETADIFALYNDKLTPTPAIDAAFAQLAQERVHAHPARYYAELPVLRLVDMWLRPRTEMSSTPLDWWNFRAHWRASSKSLAAALVNLGYLLLAAAGLREWRRREWSGRRPLAFAMIAFVLMRSALLLTMDNSEPRYTVDCFPVLILLSGIGLSARVRARR